MFSPAAEMPRKEIISLKRGADWRGGWQGIRDTVSQVTTSTNPHLGRVLINRVVSSGWSMSALHPKADIRPRIEHVCFVPIPDIAVR